jgi:hypothetical protein
VREREREKRERERDRQREREIKIVQKIERKKLAANIEIESIVFGRPRSGHWRFGVSFKTFSQTGADVNYTDTNCSFPLLFAVARGDADMVRQRRGVKVTVAPRVRSAQSIHFVQVSI